MDGIILFSVRMRKKITIRDLIYRGEFTNLQFLLDSEI